MCEQQPQDTEQATTQTEEHAAPWNADDFNPEKAWRLVQNLRQEVDDLKTKNTQISQQSTEQAQALADVTAQRDHEVLTHTFDRMVAGNPMLRDAKLEDVGPVEPGHESEAIQAYLDHVELEAYRNGLDRRLNPVHYNRAKPTGGSDPSRSAKRQDWLGSALDDMA